jgi:hypothetical protein
MLRERDEVVEDLQRAARRQNLLSAPNRIGPGFGETADAKSAGCVDGNQFAPSLGCGIRRPPSQRLSDQRCVAFRRTGRREMRRIGFSPFQSEIRASEDETMDLSIAQFADPRRADCGDFVQSDFAVYHDGALAA